MAAATHFYLALLLVGLSASYARGTGLASLPSFPSSQGRPSPFGSGFGGFGSNGDGSASTQKDDEKFEVEMKRGGCRENLTNSVKASIKQTIVHEIPETQLPMDSELRETLADRAGELLGDAIEENVTGGNAADATATGFIVACHAEPELMPACILAKPLVRKAALESILALCRTSECCKKNSSTTQAPVQ